MELNMTKPVSVSAVVSRINRRLAAQGIKLHVLKLKSSEYVRYGRYALHDGTQFLETDLEALARSLHALKPSESISTD